MKFHETYTVNLVVLPECKTLQCSWTGLKQSAGVLAGRCSLYALQHALNVESLVQVVGLGFDQLPEGTCQINVKTDYLICNLTNQNNKLEAKQKLIFCKEALIYVDFFMHVKIFKCIYEKKKLLQL